jgi:hypothetical protein
MQACVAPSFHMSSQLSADSDVLLGKGCMHKYSTAAAIIIIIIPCKPYLSASATAPHPLGRRKVERLFSLFSV